MEFDKNFRDDKDRGQVKEVEEKVPVLDIPYFYREDEFESELDLPCRDLLRLIDSEKTSSHLHDEASEEFDAKIKMYAYPYAVAFELAKVSRIQPL